MAALSPSRTLVLVQAPLVSRDLAFELDRIGWTVVGVQPSDLDLGTIERLANDLSPCAFLGINHSPELAWAVTRAGIRYISWTVDPLPLERLLVFEGTVVDLVSVFLHRSSQVDMFRAMGFPRVEWLPLAAPAHRFLDGQAGFPGDLPPSFVGSSLLDELALYRDATTAWGWSDDLARVVESTLEPLVDLALSEVSFAGFRPDGGDLPGSLRSLVAAAPEVVAQAMNAWLSAQVRRRRVAGADMGGVAVHGDGGWTDLVGDRWKGPLADGQEMTTVYRRSLASLDVPRIHQRDIATLRAFDVAAAGGCLVAEPSHDLCRVFDVGVEFLPYRTGRELSDTIARLREDPRLARAVGDAARRRAESDHRLSSRADRLLEGIFDRGGL